MTAFIFEAHCVAEIMDRRSKLLLERANLNQDLTGQGCILMSSIPMLFSLFHV